MTLRTIYAVVDSVGSGRCSECRIDVVTIRTGEIVSAVAIIGCLAIVTATHSFHTTCEVSARTSFAHNWLSALGTLVQFYTSIVVVLKELSEISTCTSNWSFSGCISSTNAEESRRIWVAVWVVYTQMLVDGAVRSLLFTGVDDHLVAVGSK